MIHANERQPLTTAGNFQGDTTMNATANQLYRYQEDGTVEFSRSALTQANNAIAHARRNTPEDVRHLFRSAIRFNGSGYSWWWILK